MTTNKIGLIIENKKSTSSFGADIFSIDFDATLSESHNWSNEVTSNPVENGSAISDNILNLPTKIKLTGFITNSPIFNDLEKKDGANQENSGDVSNDDDRVDKALGLMKKLIDSNPIVTVYTKYFVYPDMAITSINFDRDSTTGNSIEVDIEFIKVKLVETQAVQVPNGISRKLDKKSGPGIKEKTDPKKNAGTKQSEESKGSVAVNAVAGIKKEISGLFK